MQLDGSILQVEVQVALHYFVARRVPEGERIVVTGFIPFEGKSVDKEA